MIRKIIYEIEHPHSQDFIHEQQIYREDIKYINTSCGCSSSKVEDNKIIFKVNYNKLPHPRFKSSNDTYTKTVDMNITYSDDTETKVIYHIIVQND